MSTEGQEYVGVLKWHNEAKGFGFVDTKDPELGDIFVHAEIWKDAALKPPKPQTLVRVMAVRLGKQLRATKVVHVGN